MKIESNRSTQDTQATSQAEAARKLAEGARTVKTADRPVTGTSDKVEVSADAQLFAAALKATNEVAPVRADRVEAARQKLAAGELGNDSGRLADRILDDLLKP